MDSLSDMVSFGAAPALIVYEWALKGLGKLGWIAAFVYCSGARLRLARFNTNIAVVDKRFFQGLPSPAAAALLIGFIWVMDDAGFKDVSRIDWLPGSPSAHAVRRAHDGHQRAVLQLQGRELQAHRAFIVIVAIALGIAVINIHPPLVLFGCSSSTACPATASTLQRVQGQAGQRDRHLDAGARRRGLHR
jgi:CDP-diacylglycerol--serine O-phosphatidyltransferase